MSKLLSTNITLNTDLINEKIEMYLSNIKRNYNNLCVIVPTYVGLPFQFDFKYDRQNNTNHTGELIIFDLKNTDQYKVFQIDSNTNTELFENIFNCSSNDFSTYCKIRAGTPYLPCTYVVEGVLGIHKDYINKNITLDTYVQFCDELTFERTIKRKRDAIIKEDFIKYIQTYANINNIFQPEYFDLKNIKQSLIIIHPAEFNYLVHFKFIDSLITLNKYGFSTRLCDIKICLPYKKIILESINQIVNTCPYLLSGISLECETSVTDEQSVIIPFEHDTV
jgi:hypothetical protein